MSADEPMDPTNGHEPVDPTLANEATAPQSTSPNDATSTRRKLSNRTKAIVSGAAVLVLAGGAFGLYAAMSNDDSKSSNDLRGPGGPMRGGGATFGIVSSVDGSTFEVTSNDKTVKVTTSSATTFTDTKKGTFTDLKTGDNLTVMGAADSAGVVTATRITDTQDIANGASARGGFGMGGPNEGDLGGRPRPDGQRPGGEAGGPVGGGERVAGTIKSISGDTIVVAKSDGSTTDVKTGTDTQYEITTKTDMKSIAKGDQISVVGKTTGDNAVTATAVREGAMVGPQGGMGRGNERRGGRN